MVAALLTLTTFCQLPQEILDAETYTCRIVCDRGAKEAYGSGVLIHGNITSGANKGKRYVLTCWHVVVNARRTIEVTWDGENWYSARVGAARKKDDSALLVLDSWPDTVCGKAALGLRLADYEVQMGETVYFLGFDGPSNTLKTGTGKAEGPVQSRGNGGEKWFSLSGTSTDGMSGGPIVVLRETQTGREAQLIGSLWGTGAGSTIGCRLSVMYALWGRGEPPRSLEGLAQSLQDVPSKTEPQLQPATASTPQLVPSHQPTYNIRQPGTRATRPAT